MSAVKFPPKLLSFESTLMPKAKRVKVKRTYKIVPSQDPSHFPKPVFSEPNKEKLENRVSLTPKTLNKLKQAMRRNIIPLPPKPTKINRKRSRNELIPFSEESIELSNLKGNSKIDQTSRQKLDFSGKYQLNGKDHIILKQRENSTECGAAAAFMLYSDEVINGNINSELEDPKHAFWGWYSKSRLYNANDIENGLNLLEGLMKNHTYIERRRSKIASAKDLTNILSPLLKFSSVIINITNKVIRGHFIVVDDVTENRIFFRDSYTGKAYEMELNSFFKENLKEDSDIPIDLINLRKEVPKK